MPGQTVAPPATTPDRLGGKRFNVSYDGHTAVLSLHRFGNEETWLLTGWDDVESDGANAGNANDTYASDSSGIRSQEGADRTSVVPSKPESGDAGHAGLQRKAQALGRRVRHDRAVARSTSNQRDP